MVYKAADYEQAMDLLETMISYVTSTLKLPMDSDQLAEVSADQVKNKFGEKKDMATVIVNLTHASIKARCVMKKMHGENFDLLGKVSDLSTGLLKEVSAKVDSTGAALTEEIVELKSTVESVKSMKSSTESPSFAEVLGAGNLAPIIAPVKKAIQEIDHEKKKASSVVVVGVDIDPDKVTPKWNKWDEMRTTAAKAIELLLDESGSGCKIINDDDFEFLGKATEVGDRIKAPLIRVNVGSERLASLIVRYGNALKKTEFKNVYVRMDMSLEEREKRKELVKILKDKIISFPEQHWVIRGDRVTSTGNRKSDN